MSNIGKVKIKYRIGKSRLAQAIIMIVAFLTTVPLMAIIFYIFKEGITKINWNFLTHIPAPVGETGGGIVNALLGSLMIVAVAAVVAVPVGIMCGIYLSENKTSRLSYWSRLAVDVLQGIPLNSNWHCCLFLAGKISRNFFCFVRKRCISNYDVADPGKINRRNIKDDSFFFKRSGACIRNALSQSDTTNYCSLRNEWNSFRSNVGSSKSGGRNSAIVVYRFW